MEKEIFIEKSRPKSELEVLREVLPHYFDKNGKFLVEKFKSLIEESKNDISKESYGLEWLGKSYARVLATEPARTLLKEDKEWNLREENKNSKNLLIKGDNLEVLKHLINAYYGKVKMIYIDPPYNTGDDGFIYQDDRRFTKEELAKLAGISEEKAQRILDFISSKSNSHSAWLTFMYPRLYIAKQLLKEDGAIFVSIDDNEAAQLRILMDEIFGEENFVAQFVWQKNFAPKNDNKYISISHEYIILYAKNKEYFKRRLLPREEKHNKAYKNPDNDPRGPWTSGSMLATTFSEKGVFEIVSPTGKKHLPPKGRCWRFSKEKVDELIKDNRIWFGKDGNGVPRIKRFLSEMPKGIVPQTWLTYKDVGSMQDGSNELKEIFENHVLFNFPKPTKLIKHFLKIATEGSDIVLDFFAGSGTTGDAVMQLNVEDGGNRRYILVQLPEPIDPKRNKTAYEFVKNKLKVKNPTVFEITKERLVRAVKKIAQDKKREILKIKEEINRINAKDKKTKKDKEKLEELKNELEKLKELLERINQIDSGFKVFETVKIPEEYFEEPDKLTENLKLFEGYDEDDLNALLTTWKVFDGIPLEKELKEETINGYKIHYSDDKLYLMYKGFNTNILVKILEKIDMDKNFNPKKIVINGYNFNSKAQREIDESIRSYRNKKSLNIDVVIRY